jgi:hypothetical protein
MSNNSKKNNEKISIEKTDKDKLKTKKTYSKKKKLKKIFYLVLLMLSPLLTTQSYQLLI